MDLAEIDRPVETKTLKTGRLRSAIHRQQPIYRFYDHVSDDLLLQFVSPGVMIIVHHVDEHAVFLHEPDSFGIFGYQAEAFQQGFSPDHESIHRTGRLSQAGILLKDMEALALIIEQREREMAREIANCAEL